MPSPWPKTLEQLREDGYAYQERSKCLAPTCDVEIYWFITPNQKWMPLELVAGGNIQTQAEERSVEPEVRYQAHFASCPEARKFSRKTKDQVERRSA